MKNRRPDKENIIKEIKQFISSIMIYKNSI